MELSLRTSLEAEIAVEGAIVVPGRLLLDIVRQLPEGEVVLEHRPEEWDRWRVLSAGPFPGSGRD